MNKLTPIDPEPRRATAELMQVLANAALDPAYDLDRMDRIFTMYLDLQARADMVAALAIQKEQETEFYAAMTAAQSEMRAVATDKRNAETHSDYATYYALDRMARPVYAKHGFDITFDTSTHTNPDWINVLCRVGHTSGFARNWCFPVPADGKGAKGGSVMTKTHALRSAVTYGRHTILSMVFNLVIGGDGDDDGNGAGGGQTEDLPESVRAYIDRAREAMEVLQTPAELRSWWLAEAPVRDQLDLVNTRSRGPKPGYIELFAAYVNRGKELSP